MRAELLKECSWAEEYSTYNAEGHHQAHDRLCTSGRILQLTPIVIGAILAALTATQILPLYGAWLAAASAVCSGFAEVLNPFAAAESHLRSAKGFTILKQDARALRDTFSHGQSDDALRPQVQSLLARYHDLVRQAPPIPDKDFMKGREKVQKDIHKSDRPSA